jgi:DNA-binding NarL/FixJ family response regulator
MVRAMTNSMRLILVHEDPLFRECVAAALAATGRFAGVTLAADAEQARAAVGQESSDVLLVQWDLPARSALALARHVASSCPRVPVILLGLPWTCEAVRDCAEAGGAGYILKGESLEDMLARIAEAARGETACSPRAARFLFGYLAELARQRPPRGENHETDLTTRELEILSLIADGLSNKEIAARLCLSLHTVKNHVHSLLEKLAVGSRHAAVRHAREKHWLDDIPSAHSLPLRGRPPYLYAERPDAGSPPA